MWKLAAFVVISAGLIWLSRASLRAPRSHGFYRFFAFEGIVALFLFQVDAWFRNPSSWHQVISWILLTVSFVPLGFGVHALATRGRAVRHREDDAQLYAFEKTTELVTTGIFRYIRHPMYSSLLLLAWGLFLKSLAWPSALLVFIATVSLFATAKADEAECVKFFGPAYQAYMERSKRFVPFLF